MSEIIQLAPDGLQELFLRSMPRDLRLPGHTAGRAMLMSKAGLDAYAIAERLDVPVHSISTFLRRVAEAEAKAEASRHERQAVQDAERKAIAEAEARLVQRQSSASSAQRVGATPVPAVPTSAAPLPDADLSLLQRGAIRLLRIHGSTPEQLALAFSTSPDHIKRICREVPQA